VEGRKREGWKGVRGKEGKGESKNYIEREGKSE